MNGLPYYKAYPRDFIEGTIGMPFEVKCAYRVVLDLIYLQGGRLPDDPRYISGNLGCSIRKWKSIRDHLIQSGKLHVSGEFLTNKRADNELETLSKYRENQAENARKPRKCKDLKKPPQSQRALKPEPEPYSKRDTNVSIGLSAPEPSSPLSEAVQIYNDTAADAGWPKVQKLTPARSKALKARLADCGGVEGWRFAMDKGKASDFLCGRTEKPWTGCGFDWLTKQANFTKLMEGNYDNRPDNAKATGTDTANRSIAIAAGFARSPSRDCF